MALKRIIYLILAHRDPALVARLIDRLDHPDDRFVLHLDKKIPKKLFGEFQELLAHRKNVILPPKRISCYWGDFSTVRAELLLMAYVKELGFEYDKVMLLSGSHYPIKKRDVIRAFVLDNPESIYMKHWDLPVGPSHPWACEDGGMDRLLRWNFIRFSCIQKLAGLIWKIFGKWGLRVYLSRKYKFSLKPFGGSQWWCLDRQSLEYVLSFCAENALFVSFFKFVLLPDEIFLQTILLNSPHRARIVNDDLCWCSWPLGKDNAHPRVLLREDFPDILNRRELFARKFDSRKDLCILQLIDARLSR